MPGPQSLGPGQRVVHAAPLPLPRPALRPYGQTSQALSGLAPARVTQPQGSGPTAEVPGRPAGSAGDTLCWDEGRERAGLSSGNPWTRSSIAALRSPDPNPEAPPTGGSPAVCPDSAILPETAPLTRSLRSATPLSSVHSPVTSPGPSLLRGALYPRALLPARPHSPPAPGVCRSGAPRAPTGGQRPPLSCALPPRRPPRRSQSIPGSKWFWKTSPPKKLQKDMAPAGQHGDRRLGQLRDH